MKFKIGDMANGIEVSEVVIEADNYVEALKQVLETANLYCRGADEEAEEHIYRLHDRLFKAPL